ncbi:hypothetical protein SAMN05660976_08502, partial [Nonomuraea pusilla]
VAAWLWERGMAIERHRIRGTGRIHWRLTPERVLVRLGLAEATDRTAGEVDRQRRITRVALAALKVDDQQAAKPRRRAKALAHFRSRIAQAVEHAQLATDAAAQKALLAQIDTLRSADALVARRRTARWADPVTQEQREAADTAMADLLALDSAEAIQRAKDKAAVTLIALTERVTSDVTSERVNQEINSTVNSSPTQTPRQSEKLTIPMTPALTFSAVNAGINFDVNDPTAYDLDRILSGDPYMTPWMTPDLTGDVTGREVKTEVNGDRNRASKTQLMRAFWDSEVAQDRYPSVTALSEHAGVDSGYASRKRKEWVAELHWWQRRKADPKKVPAS